MSEAQTRLRGAQVPARSDSPVPGVDLGEVIGRGGFATVYRGRQVALDREVAVKIDSRPLSDERNRRRFLREATAASRIGGHPHVVSLFDAGTTTDGLPYLVMELCPNGSLADLIRRVGNLAPVDARDLGLAMCSALAAAHAAGILHRDIKPANVLIDHYGTPRLSDFGLAALPSPGQDLSVTLEALTPAYAAPEAFSSAEPTPASDVWSMGATLHAMLTPRSPRRTGDGRPASIDVVIAHLAEPLPDPGIPGTEELVEVIRRATSFDPAERFADGQALYAALQATRVPEASGPRVVGGPEASVLALPPPAPPPAPARASGRGRMLAAGAGLAAGLLAGTALGFLLDTGSGSSTPQSPAASTNETPSASKPPAASAPEVGACFRGITVIGGQPASASSGSCTSPHYWEAYASGIATGDSPLPDDLAADSAVTQTCTKRALKDYVGGGPTHSLNVEVLPVSIFEWQDGNHGFSCVVSAGQTSQPIGAGNN